MNDRKLWEHQETYQVAGFTCELCTMKSPLREGWLCTWIVGNVDGTLATGCESGSSERHVLVIARSRMNEAAMGGRRLIDAAVRRAFPRTVSA